MRSTALTHKHLNLDQRKIDFAKRYFGAKSEQEAIDRALSLLMEEERIIRSMKPLAGLPPGRRARMALPVAGKVVLDTNVFIDYLRQDRYEDWVFGRVGSTIRFLSSVVLMELRFGADTPRRQRAVDRIKAAFPSGRLIAPTPDLFERAGTLLRMLHGDGTGLADRLGPCSDLLIALSAWQIGATVVTRNTAEFARIQRRLPALAIASPPVHRPSKTSSTSPDTRVVRASSPPLPCRAAA